MKAIRILFVFLAIFYSCVNRSERGAFKGEKVSNSADSLSQNQLTEIKNKLNINFFIENSGSMFGYVNGRTKFKDVLNNFLVDLKYYYGEDNISIYFINSQVHRTPLSNDVINFAGQLSPSSMRVGNVSNSNINYIYKTIIDSLKDDNLNFLVSDNIYSIKGTNTLNLLGEQQALTKDAFLSLKNKNVATDFYQYESEFNGVYYDLDNTPISLNCYRPFYVTVIGEEKNLDDYLNNFNEKFESYNGFKNRFYISNLEKNNLDYTLLQNSFNNVQIKPQKKGAKVIHNASIKKGRNKSDSIQFAVAANFSTFKGLSQNLINKDNYKLTDSFFIEDIGTIENDKVKFKDKTLSLNPSDINRISDSGYTHVFIIKTPLKVVKDFSISLERIYPKWVVSSSTVDDKNIASNKAEQSKTFGLEYMVKGMAEAYQMKSNEDNYFTLNLNLNSTSSSNTGIYIILGFLVIIIGAFLILKKIK